MTGEELAQKRKAAGLRQVDLAQRVGIGRHAVSYWESKTLVDLSAWAVKRMAEVLDLPKPRPMAAWEQRLAEREAELFAAEVARIKARAEAYAAKRRVRCNAKTRKNTPCRCKSEPGKRRCKFHGGMSTGARTPEGLERIREAQRRRWARWRAERAEDEALNAIADARQGQAETTVKLDAS